MGHLVYSSVILGLSPQGIICQTDRLTGTKHLGLNELAKIFFILQRQLPFEVPLFIDFNALEVLVLSIFCF